MTWDWFHLGNPEALHWLWLLVPMSLLFAYDWRRRQRVLRLFVERSLLDEVSPRRSVGRPIVKFALLCLALASLVVALARPQWDPKQIEIHQAGQNLLFCVDVSNSMRCRDVDPSRLEAAKAAIKSLLSDLPAGNQVGLLAYAGNAELKCPLTPNYRHLALEVDRLTYNSVSEGGSNLGDAIFKATRDVFGLRPEPANTSQADGGEGGQGRDKTAGEMTRLEPEARDEDIANVLIVLTDGENHEGHAKAAAQRAHELGVGIYIISLGTEAGGPIPIGENGQARYLEYKGERVITRVDNATLRGIIDGLNERVGYLAAGSANVDLTDIYENVIARQGQEIKTLRQTVWQEQFQLFVGIGLGLLMVSGLLSEQRPGGRRREGR